MSVGTIASGTAYIFAGRREVRTSRLSVRDKAGVERCAIEADYLGGGLVVRDVQGRAIAELRVGGGEPAHATLEFLDAKGKQRLVLGSMLRDLGSADTILSRPLSSIVLLDDAGRAVWRVPREPWVENVEAGGDSQAEPREGKKAASENGNTNRSEQQDK